MSNTVPNFADNTQKREARDMLCAKANYHFKHSTDLNMLELLGLGVGANYYLENINNIKNIDCIEENKELFYAYIPPSNKIVKHKQDLYSYIHLCEDNVKYNIINLDFCSFFCEDSMISKISTGHIIKKLFRKRIFNVGSLIFTTFCIQGRPINIWSNRYNVFTDHKEICDRIVAIAAEYNIKISLGNEILCYEPDRKRGKTVMMHACFTVDEML